MLRQWFQDALWKDQFGSAEVGEKTLVVLGPGAVCMSLCCRIILGLSAMPRTFEEVQKAYRIRAKAVHPDRPCWVIWKAMLQEMFLVDMEARDSTILIILCQLRPVTSLNIRAGRRAGNCSTWPPTTHQFCAAVRSVPRRGPIIGSWLRMAERPACVEEWFDCLPQLLAPQGWDIASDRHGTLSHCPCPWGGRLIKITLDGLLPCWRVRFEFFFVHNFGVSLLQSCDLKAVFRSKKRRKGLKFNSHEFNAIKDATVDGRNPAPPGMHKTS